MVLAHAGAGGSLRNAAGGRDEVGGAAEGGRGKAPGGQGLCGVRFSYSTHRFSKFNPFVEYFLQVL